VVFSTAVGKANVDQKPDTITLTDAMRRVLGFWAADCAARVLPLYEAKAPADMRPRAAIEGIRAYAQGEKRTARLRALVWAAYAAAREIGEPAATAAARSAGCAAGTAYMHDIVTPHQVKHVLAPAMYAALACASAADDNSSVGDEEIAWAIEHAPAEVREIVRQMPARKPGRSRQDTLLYRLDAGLRG
jgi:hypothetical protein